MRLVNWRALVVGAVGLGLAACGDDVTVTPTPPTITLNPASIQCTTGQTTAAGVTVTGGSNTSVAFSAGGSGVTVTPNGASGATVVCGNTPGSAVINVVVTSGGQTYNAAIPVTINPSSTGTSVIALSLSPAAASLTPGASTTITPTVTLASGAAANTTTDVTYTSSSTAVTVTRQTNNTALVTVAANAPVGTQAVITATANANTNLRAFSTITVVGTNTLVSGITVSPTTVGLNVGGTQAITSSVQLAAGAPAGTSQNVTCSSSNTAVATVNNTTAPGGTSCTVTAVSNGVATITISSVAAPGVQQLVSVNVSSPAPVRLTIQGINVVNAAGQNVPADLTNVAGNLFLTMNLDPGDNRPDSVVVTIGGQRVNCQRFSVQLVQAYRDALLSGSADVQPITCQINTSQFNSTTGAPLVLNGQQPLSATVFFRPGTTGTGAASQQTATIQQNLTVNNQSGFFVSVTNTPGATQAANNGGVSQTTGPQGVVWRSGSINVTVLPVNFATPGSSGAGSPAFAATTVSLVDCPAFGAGVCGAQRVVATRTTTPTAAGALTGSVTFTGDTGCWWDVPGANNAISNFGGLVGYQQLFTNATTAAGGSGQGFCSGIASGIGTGFAADPTQNTLEGYTTPNAGATTTGSSAIPANAQIGTYVVVGSNVAQFGNALSGTAILNANGQPLGPANQPANTPGFLGGNVATVLFIDNQAPEPIAQANFPTTNFSTSLDPSQTATRVSGFFNANQTFTAASFGFAYIDPATGALVATNPDFGGVDRVTDQFFAVSLAATGSTNPNTVTGNGSRITVTNASNIPSLTVNNFYRLAVAEIDALGNRRNSIVNQVFNPGTPGAALVQTFFNVDISAPVLTLVAGPQNVSSTNQVFGPRAVRTGFSFTSNVVANPQLVFSFSDDIGFGPTPLSVTLARYRRSGSGGAVVDCFSGVDATGLAQFNDQVGVTVASCPAVLTAGTPILLPNTAAAAGVYSGSVQARDQAGNLSNAIAVQFVIDLTPPGNISLGLPQQLVGNSTVTFTAGATDNLAVASGAPRVNYAATSLPTPAGTPAGAVPQSLIYPENRILNLASIFASLLPNGNSSFSVLPQNQTAMTLTIPNFIRTITATQSFAGANPGSPVTVPGTTTAVSYTTAQSLQAEIFDLANNVGISTALPIPAANIPNVPGASPFISAANQVNNIGTFNLYVETAGTTVGFTQATGPSAANQSRIICGPVNVAAGCPGSVQFVAVQTGQLSTYVSQLVRIELWVYDPVANGFRQLATMPAGAVTDDPAAPATNGRRITSVLPFAVNTLPYFLAPASGQPGTAYEVIAIGVNGSGDAISSNLVTVTINP